MIILPATECFHQALNDGPLIEVSQPISITRLIDARKLRIRSMSNMRAAGHYGRDIREGGDLFEKAGRRPNGAHGNLS